MSPIMDLSHIYNVSLHKLHSFQVTRRDSTDGLRKLVLINSFVYNKFVAPEEYEPLEWSDEDIKRDEYNWLEECLDDLNQEEDEDGYVCISRSEDIVSPSPARTTTADETTISTIAEDIIRPTIFVESTLEPTSRPFSSTAHSRLPSSPPLPSPPLPSPPADSTTDLSPKHTVSTDHNHRIIPQPSPTSPPNLSAYRPFFDSAIQHAIPKLNMIVGAPRFYQKFCLDRDYLAGISMDLFDGAITSDPILDFVIAETRRYDAVKRSKDDLDLITKEKWIVQRLINEIESGRIWFIDGYESGRRQKMACF